MKLSKEQRRVATQLIRIGRRMGASKKDIITALTVGLVEANLTNPRYGDGTSVGWRQEIDTYGSVGNRMNINRSARRFYQELRKAPSGSIGMRAQAVQRSAYPDRYGQRVGEAKSILRMLNNQGISPINAGGGIAAPNGILRGMSPSDRLNFVQSLNLGTDKDDEVSFDASPFIQLATQNAQKTNQTNQVKQPGKSSGTNIPSVNVSKSSGSAIRLGTKGARKFGLTVTSTTGGSHVPGSYHYKRRAVDVAGSPRQMMKFFKWARRFRPTELFYDPAGYYYKNGKRVRGSIGGHSDHVHFAL